MSRIRVALAVAALTLGLAAAPAAAFDFSGCGKFDLIARDSIVFELSPNTLLTGNVLVLDPNGSVKLGNGNDVKGTIFAHKITLGQGSVAAVCVADVIEGAGTCLVEHTPFVAPPGCTLQPFPPGVTIPSLPAVCAPGTALVLTADTTLDPGCYASLRVANGVTVTLESGAFYAIKGNALVGIGATVQASTAGVPATLFTGGTTTFSNNDVLNDLRVFQLGTATVLSIFNGSVLDNTLIVSPTRAVHIHTGSILKGGSALAAPVLDVQPITSLFDVTPIVCECPAGTHFANATTRDCVPD